MYFKSVNVVVLFLLAGISSAATGNQNTPVDDGTSVSLDQETLRCMQCHDGVSARDVELSFLGLETGMSSLHSGKHPIGMKYMDYVLSRPLEYYPQDGLNSNIQLVNGQVSCVSCHQVRQGFELQTSLSQLVEYEVTACLSSSDLNKGINQSGLCLSCHIK